MKVRDVFLDFVFRQPPIDAYDNDLVSLGRYFNRLVSIKET
jgi:hypothetical protein